jgi:hypothetical protein
MGAHASILQRIVDDSITTALILADQTRWHPQIRKQLQDFAVASNALLHAALRGLEGTIPLSDIPLDGYVPRTSPYGDNWDILWLGHCNQTIQEGLHVIQQNDSTIYQDTQYAVRPAGLTRCSEWSRMIFKSTRGACSYAYAISQQGARKILAQAHRLKPDRPFDNLISQFCAGRSGHGSSKPGTCIAVTPPLFTPRTLVPGAGVAQTTRDL